MRSKRAPRRHDPNRRARIIAACLDVIAVGGVAGTSHRKVAEAADVPLGSMTYHFDGMESLLRAAFEAFADEIVERFEVRLAAAADTDAAREAVVAIIEQDVLGSARDLILTSELYALAARAPGFRSITDRWMSRSRSALERHFDPLTARLVDALIEGISLHTTLSVDREDASAFVRSAVDRATGAG